MSVQDLTSQAACGPHAAAHRDKSARVACVRLGFLVAMLGSMPLMAQAADQDIPNVVVTDTRIGATDELVGSKIALPANDIPVGAERLDIDTIERTGFATLAPLLQATSSVIASPADGNAFNDFLLRGFANTSIYRNGVIDSITDRPARMLANVARIEVLKGPSGALYGPGQPGGSINFVTKRPLPDFATDLELGAGSYDETIVGLDSTGPLMPGDALNYRFIARQEQSDTFRDFVKDQRLFVNPMLSGQAGPDIHYDASFEYVREERLFDAGVVAVDGSLPLPHSRFLGEPNSGNGKLDGYTFQLSSMIDLRAEWQLELSLNGQKAASRGRAVEPDELLLDDGNVTLNRAATNRSNSSTALVAQAELGSDAVHWYVPHHFLAGVSATGLNEDILFQASDPDDDPYAINVFAPVYGAAAPTLRPERDSSEKSRQFSIYTQDLIELDENWRFLLGLRFDHIDQSGSDIVSSSRFKRISNEVSPRVGLVFKPNQSWSLFASYSGSIEPNEGLQPDGSPLVPTRSDAIETGVKWNSARYPVSIDAAVFSINQTNVTTEAPGNPGFELQTGEQESIGADVEIRAQPSDWFSLTGRYSFVDAQVLNDINVSDGTTPLNVAKHQVSALGLVHASLITPRDVSFAVALNYLSDRQGSLEPDELALKLPGYFRGDLFIAWRHSEHLALSLGIENFTDTQYIQGSQSDGLHLMPGTPLNFRGQIKLSF